MTTIQIQVPEPLAKLYLRFGEKDFIEGMRYSAKMSLQKEKKDLKGIMQRIKKFEKKYKTNFENFEKNFPPGGDYQIHEDYGEWSFLVDVAKATEKDIDYYARLLDEF